MVGECLRMGFRAQADVAIVDSDVGSKNLDKGGGSKETESYVQAWLAA